MRKIWKNIYLLKCFDLIEHHQQQIESDNLKSSLKSPSYIFPPLPYCVLEENYVNCRDL